MSGRFISVVGPSGVGKDSVMTALAGDCGDIRLARRIITRASDAGGEVFDGVTPAEFAERRANGDFALWWEAHGMSYAIPRNVDQDLANGRDVLANLSRSVLEQAAHRFERTEIIFLTAQPDILAQRLAQRGRETPEDIARRLERAGIALPAHLPAHRIDNSGTLAETVAAIRARLYPASVAR
jgi:ribose 1,5-bisphosphokinase